MKPTLIEAQERQPVFRKLKDHSITVGAVRIPVILVKPGTKEYKKHKGKAGGWWHGSTGSVYIMDDLPPMLQNKILFHELVHACNDIGLCFELTPTE